MIFKVTLDHSYWCHIRWSTNDFLLVFNCNFVSTFSIFEIVSLFSYQYLKRSCDPKHPIWRVNIMHLRWYSPRSMCIPNLKCLVSRFLPVVATRRGPKIWMCHVTLSTLFVVFVNPRLPSDNTCVQNLKTLPSAIPKVCRKTQNVKIVWSGVVTSLKVVGYIIVERAHTTSYSILVQGMRLFCTVFEI